MPFNLDKYGSFSPFKWDHDYLVKVLTTGHNRIVKNPRLILALKEINRKNFLPEKYADDAYIDKEIDIGFDQKISKPTTTTFMIELSRPKVGDRVLDIGTGSGWTSALYGFIVGEKGKVITVERHQYLLDFARQNVLKYKDLKNIEFIFRDASLGLPDRAPYDIIHISACYEDIPEQIKEQLNIGGRIVAPSMDMHIKLIERETKDKWKETIHQGIILDKIEKGIN